MFSLKVGCCSSPGQKNKEKCFDCKQRVIYVGSFSVYLSTLGFIVLTGDQF